MDDFGVKRRERILARIIPMKRGKKKQKKKEGGKRFRWKKRKKRKRNNDYSIVLQIALPATAIHQALESSGGGKNKQKDKKGINKSARVKTAACQSQILENICFFLRAEQRARSRFSYR